MPNTDMLTLEEMMGENADLKSALNATKHKLEDVVQQCQRKEEYLDQTQKAYNRLREQNEETKTNFIKQAEEKKNFEARMADALRKVETGQIMKQKENEELQVRLLNTHDIELEKMKIKNKLELQYNQEIEKRQSKIENLVSELDELKRNYELLNARYNSISRDHENEIDFLKESHKIQVNELINEISSLQNQNSSDIYKDKYHELKRESETIKGRNETFQKEMNDINLELERLRREKTDNLVNNSKLLESERAERRDQKVLYEKLVMRNKYQDDESKQHNDKVEKLEKKIFELMDERQKTVEHDAGKDKRIFDLKLELQEVENSFRKRDQEFREKTLKELTREKNSNSDLSNKVREHVVERDILEKKSRKKEQQENDKNKEIKRDLKETEAINQNLNSELRRTKEELTYAQIANNEFTLKNEDLSEKMRHNSKLLDDKKNDALILQRELSGKTGELRELKQKLKVFPENDEPIEQKKDDKIDKALLEKYNSLKKKLKMANRKIIDLLSEKVIAGETNDQNIINNAKNEDEKYGAEPKKAQNFLPQQYIDPAMLNQQAPNNGMPSVDPRYNSNGMQQAYQSYNNNGYPMMQPMPPQNNINALLGNPSPVGLQMNDPNFVLPSQNYNNNLGQINPQNYNNNLGQVNSQNYNSNLGQVNTDSLPQAEFANNNMEDRKPFVGNDIGKLKDDEVSGRIQNLFSDMGKFYG